MGLGRDAVERRVIAGRWDLILRGISWTTGVRDADYLDPERLRARLDRFRARFRGDLGAQIALLLPTVLAAVNRPADALRVYEALLRTPADRPYAATAPRELRTISGENVSLSTNALLNMVAVLFRLGRAEEAHDLLLADLTMDTDAQLTTADAFWTAVSKRLGALPRTDRGAYLGIILVDLEQMPGGEPGFAAAESILGLDGPDPAAELTERLDFWFGGVPAPQMLVPLSALAFRWHERGESARALAAVEWCTRVEPGDYRIAGRLAARLRALTAATNPEAIVPLFRSWVEALVACGRTEDATAVIEADSGLTRAVLADPARLDTLLARRLAVFDSSNSAVIYVEALVIALTETGRPDEGATAADWFLARYPGLHEVPADGDPNIVHVVGLLGHQLRWSTPADPRQTWELCGQSVGYLRAGVAGELTLADRRRLANAIELLRRRIRDTAARLVGTGPEAERRAVTAQLWDAELGQRVLFEEFLLTTVRTVAPGQPPGEQWPLTRSEPAFTGHLPDPSDWEEAETNRLWRRRTGTRRTAPPRAADQPVPIAEPWLAEAGRLVRAGVTEELLATSIGDGGLLVRAGFRSDGSLTWTALRVAGTSLRLVASGTGTRDDRTRLRWARLRYRIRLLIGGADRSLGPEGVLTPAASLVAALTETVAALTTAVTPDQRASALGRLARSSIAADERLGEHLRELLDATLRNAQELAALGELLREELDGSLDALDAATARFLADVREVWSLESLAGELDEETDVVWQLEDVLQSYPVTHHRFDDGTALFTHVRSTRVSLSLLLTIMQQRLDHEFGTRSDRILALSYFDPDDAAARYEPWLHHGLRRIAGAGMTCLHAAEDPPGSAGTLRTALDDATGFDVVSICGHGTADDAAVELADGVWYGDGCDWRAVHLLILVSCSVGGLEQVEDREAEGLCVRLAIHRARSILACRWPVTAPHAIVFANEVAARYTASHGPHRRARAVNEARLHLLGTGEQMGRLNAVAAFELYGIG